MEKYFSHITAALKWNIPNLDRVLSPKLFNERQNGGVVDITVTDRITYHQRKNHVTHLRSDTLPRDAVILINKKYVASPEMVFLDLADILDIRRLIFLGLQMCSHPPGKPSKAVTTKHKLALFIKKTQGFRGSVAAERAIKHIEDGSNSVMESLTFMLLTLPHTYGGYGLNGAVFNHEIPLRANAEQHLRNKRFFVDLYYKKTKLAVEYDSLTHHSKPAEQGKDLLRMTTLERQGIRIMRLSSTQLYDKKAFEEFAQNVAAYIGKRIRIRTEVFTDAHRNLRDLLP